MRDKLETFKDLKDGWDSYGASAITTTSIASAITMIEILEDLGIADRCEIFPMRDGGIQIDLTFDTEAEIEILDSDIVLKMFDSENKIVKETKIII